MMQPAWMGALAAIALIVPIFLIALSVHEFSHALAATLFGDPTPGRMGRLTLNPLAHIDPLGILFLIIFRIGWAKPVIFDNRNFSWPKLQTILTAFAGPFSNFCLALVSLFAVAHLPTQLLGPAGIKTVTQIFEVNAYVNIMLGVFNMLPIPPLDGGHVIVVFLADKYPHVVSLIYRYSIFILLGIFMLPPTRIMLVKMILFVQECMRALVF